MVLIIVCTRRITEFYGLYLSSGILKNTTFRKLDLFLSSVEGVEHTYFLRPLGTTCISIITATYTPEIRVCQPEIAGKSTIQIEVM
jgi:hypothetical protein